MDSDYGPNPDLNESSAQQLLSNAESYVARLAQVLESDQPDEVDYDFEEPV